MTEAWFLAAGVVLGAALAVFVMVALVNRRERRLDNLRRHLGEGHGIDAVNLDATGEWLRGLHTGTHTVIVAEGLDAEGASSGRAAGDDGGSQPRPARAGPRADGDWRERDEPIFQPPDR